MKKGIAPVVAVVVMIAIAVIAAMGVWYWVGSYTGKPATGGQQQIAFSSPDCNRTHIKIRNTGGVDLTEDAFIYDSNDGSPAGSINFSLTNVDAGKTAWVGLYDTSGAAYTGVSLIPVSVYDVFDADYPDYTFNCPRF
jgi:flagellin-like protein